MFSSKRVKTTDKLRNYYGIVLDESGSMHPTKRDTLGSLNSFHDEQSGEYHPASPFVIHTFSNNVRIAHNKFLCDSLKDFQYKPSGATALYDAIKESISHAEKEISKMSQKPENTFIIILTDGAENSSTECSLNEVKNLFSKYKELGWQFIFLGANQDAIISGAAMGLERGQCLSFNQTPHAQVSAMKSVSQAVRRQCTNESQKVEFNDEERMESIQPF
jgi:uncharacterized protein YegL